MPDKKVKEPKAQAVFAASFPTIQSAIKFDGLGGVRFQLDVPESEVPKFLQALAWRGMVLKVTLEQETQNSLTEFDDETTEGPEGSSTHVDSRRSTKRRDQRQGG
jgi:hypothetical protein